MHANVAHWDGGDDLGARAGARGVTVERVRLAAGERLAAQAGEVFAYVRAGGGATAAGGIGEGDCVLHTGVPDLTAGAGGLELLVFVAPLRAPDPRPQRVARFAEVDGRPWGRGRVSVLSRDFGVAMDSRGSGLNHAVVVAGHTSAPLHCHSSEEEVFVVLDGAGTVTIGDHQEPVSAGVVVARPPASRQAHMFTAAAGEALTLLMYGTRVPDEYVYYPDSKKISLRGVGVIFAIDRLDYWHGEE